MKHLGDITKIDGHAAPVVDCIIGGSPCQDLSIAGQRAGLAGERSGLFMEQIRLIKEMRARDRNDGRANNTVRPRYMVWENVCFSGETLITCDDGYKRIDEIRIGDMVKTLSGEYHAVAKVYKTPRKDVIRVSAGCCEDIIVTPNHPFLTITKSRNKDGQRVFSAPCYTKAVNLAKDHMIGYRLDVPSLPATFMDKPMAWAVGRWLADGSVDLTKSNPRVFISCGLNKADEMRERLAQLPFEIYENTPHPTAINFCFTSHDFYNYISGAGIGAGNKRVPPYVFKLPDDLQAEILSGYLSGDGYTRKRGERVEICASTASRELAYGIARLIRNVHHVHAAISVHPPKDGHIGGRILHANYPSYCVYASITKKATQAYFDGEILWTPVKSVSPVSEKRTVYNLSVLEDNTYGANDVMVHNCGAFSSAGGKDFAAVLEETIGVVTESKPVLEVPDGGWPRWGAIADPDGQWSVAWRTTDTQHWGRTVRERDSGNVVEFGTPQRRRRIALVADFNGGTAADILFGNGSTVGDFGTEPRPEVLFERQGLRGDFAESGTEGQRAAAAAGTGVETANDGGTDYLTGWDFQEKRVFTPNGVAPTLSGSDGGGGRTGCGYVFHAAALRERAGCEGGGKGPLIQIEKTGTLGCSNDQTIFCMATGQANAEILTNQSPTLNCNHEQPIICLMDHQGGSVMETLLDKTGTLRAQEHGHQPVILQLYENHAQDSRITGPLDIAPTVAQKFGTGGNNTPLVLAVQQNASGECRVCPTAYTLSTNGNASGRNAPLILAFKAGQGAKAGGLGLQEEVSPTLAAGESGTNRTPVILAVDCRNFTLDPDVNGTLQAKSTGGQSLNLNNVALTVTEDGTILLDGQPCTVVRMEIRRLTPLECERLQGYPDGWTDIGPWVDSKGKPHKESSDSARYKALGNSIALPFWRWLLKRVSAQYERDATMASLFDGISGFVCLWTEINGWDSVKWTSEIDDFATAVCKKHFGDEETGERGDFYEVFFRRNKGKDV